MTPSRFALLRSVLSTAFLACVPANADTVQLALDLNPGPRGSGPSSLVAYKGDLYFRGTRFSDVGTELFRWNGTTLTVIDIYPGTGSGYPQHFAEYNGALYFSANGQAGQGTELWRYDGTALSKAGQN